MFEDTTFLQELNPVHVRHWVIHREETVKCHPAAQGAASASLTFYEKRFHGLFNKVFWFFGTESIAFLDSKPRP